MRGSFKIAGIDIGTHISLVTVAPNRFVILDSYTLSDDQFNEIVAITGGAENIEAVINLHPFHTLHVKAMRERFPKTRFYGTRRHHEKFPDIAWQPVFSEDDAMNLLYQRALNFTVPHGVQLVPANEMIHCGSVLAIHNDSKTIHVDDTFNVMAPPGNRVKKLFQGVLSFHPTLPLALEPRSTAGREFLQWANNLINHWDYAENICAAHSGVLLYPSQAAKLRARIRMAILMVRPQLVAHRLRYMLTLTANNADS